MVVVPGNLFFAGTWRSANALPRSGAAGQRHFLSGVPVHSQAVRSVQAAIFQTARA